MPENRIVLRNCGKMDPADITGYLSLGGFRGLKKACKEMSPARVIEEVKASGLRGRGGAGFPCGIKWEMAAGSKSPQKFLICNADEGEVGTFKDRYMLENDPYSMIEGMLIACYAIGVKHAFIYLREEYTFLVDKILSVIEQTTREGFSDGIEIKLVQGAGAYVCGEESALMESIEGKRGEPRYRPPFPTDIGLFNKPTVVNNVETLMNIPWIIMNGAQEFNKIGTDKSKGTKVFCVSGDVERPGIYELPMGSSLKELVYGNAGAGDVKMAQVGGGGGRIIPVEKLDMPLSYETTLGSGAVIVMDSSRDIIDVMVCSLEFFKEESCGKCTPCREGTKALVEILQSIKDGKGTLEDLQTMKEIGQVMQMSSFCGLGQTAPVPMLDSLKYFRSAYESRIEQLMYLVGLKGY